VLVPNPIDKDLDGDGLFRDELDSIVW